jgi:phospho-N-acetylmuramoyl-pentapeptide-transferase
MSTLHIAVETDTLIRVLLLGFLGFLVSMIITPIYTTLAYRFQWWKKPRTTDATGRPATILQKLHGEKHKRLIPTMAGAVTVVAASLVTLLFNLDRTETWLPLAAFAGAAAVGLADDIVNIRGTGQGKAGLPSRLKLLLTTVVALVGGLFFYYKLDVSTIHIPIVGSDLSIGWLIIPLFVLAVVSTANAVNISDGLDGLAGGLTIIAFAV